MRILRTTAFVVTAFVLLDRDLATAAMVQAATNADSEWTIQKPLTGRAIPCDQGKIKIFECQNVELLSYLPATTIGGAGGSDLWGWIDSATGREFALVGGPSGTAFVEVTDPVNPLYLGLLPSRVENSGAQSVKVYRHYAFIGYTGYVNGMQIFDLTQLRTVKTPPVMFQETAHYSDFTDTHTLALNPESGFAYANGSNTCGGGLHMIDVRTPTKPIFAGCFIESAVGGVINSDGYVHDTQCVMYRGPDQQYQGREICFNSSSGALVIADVTDKQNPKTISIARYPELGYVHQGWLTDGQQYFFLDDELTGGHQRLHTRTIGFDISDLDDPVVLTDYNNPKIKTQAHNLYIRGRYMYQGNYDSGLRIIDVVDPKNPAEVGYLTNAGSAWGTYPFFKNDVVAVPMSTGLILARLSKR